MSDQFVSRGFKGRAHDTRKTGQRLPPGQYETTDFPVLSAGPTPRVNLSEWSFSISGDVGQEKKWTWNELRKLPSEKITVDIHCVTKWSKFDTLWQGVAVETLLAAAEPRGKYLVAYSDGGYTTNLPLADVMGGKAWIVYSYNNQPLVAEHGGPARLLVPHLYFWKSAKWVRGLKIVSEDQAGFWEKLGYNMYGDPWREQRYTGD